MSADGGGTAITPAAVFQLRDELAELKAKVRVLEARLEELVQGHNDLDNRHDELEHRISGVETVQERLLSGVTTGNLTAERTERHILAVANHFRIPVS